FVKTFPLALAQADTFLNAQIGSHDLEQREPAATNSRDEPLAHNPAQHVSQPRPDLLLFVSFEHAENTIDSLAGVNGVNGAENEVPSLSGAQCDTHGVTIAHFTDQNHFGRLAQRRAQSVGEAIEICSQFPLIKRRLFMRVDKFNAVVECK